MTTFSSLQTCVSFNFSSHLRKTQSKYCCPRRNTRRTRFLLVLGSRRRTAPHCTRLCLRRWSRPLESRWSWNRKNIKPNDKCLKRNLKYRKKDCDLQTVMSKKKKVNYFTNLEQSVWLSQSFVITPWVMKPAGRLSHSSKATPVPRE